jgi:hypothetical protein
VHIRVCACSQDECTQVGDTISFVVNSVHTISFVVNSVHIIKSWQASPSDVTYVGNGVYIIRCSPLILHFNLRYKYRLN